MYGGYYGDGFNFAHRDLRGFIQREDILTITVDYKNNTILFHSMKANNTITKRLKDTTDCVRFVAEFCYNDATIDYCNYIKVIAIENLTQVWYSE